jgi:hypothetical protein
VGKLHNNFSRTAKQINKGQSAYGAGLWAVQLVAKNLKLIATD